MSKSAGTMAAIWALLSVLGLVVLIGVILVMMWFGNRIQHSPRESRTRLNKGMFQVVSVDAVAGPDGIAKNAG
ncbi:MAG TPA: hypothetical protein VKP13_11420 [Nitrospira sp.]|nr:hypothetical protein [Nitrospira sp.]